MTDKVKFKILKKLKRLHEELESMKPLYSEYDRLTTVLLSEGIMNATFGKTLFRMIDTSEGRNKIFKTTSVRIFEPRFARLK